MPHLPGVLRMPRMLRHLAATGAGLPPDEAVTLDEPDAPLRGVLRATRHGDWRPAAVLLASTRERAEWARRDAYVGRLAEQALQHPQWLHEWSAAAPDNPDAALVRADHAIVQAWEIRTAALAKDVSDEQFAAFHTLLRDAVPVLRTAADRNPGDPVPWRVAINHATGIGAPREVFDDYLARARGCDPDHWGVHTVALQYLAGKWYGSHTEMFAFAEEAAAAAEPTSLLRGLPVTAAFEYLADHGTILRTGPITRERLDAAVEQARRLSAGYPPGDPSAAAVRNTLACVLMLRGHWAEALAAFRAIGVQARSFPWSYSGEPREQFLESRRGARGQVAQGTPFFARPPHPEDAGTTTAPRAIAVCGAPLRTVREGVLVLGVTVRLAPAGAGRTFLEVAADGDGRRGLRRALLGDGPLTDLLEVAGSGGDWPAVVVSLAGEAWNLALVHQGRTLATHTWGAAADMATHTQVVDAARALARAYPDADVRALTAVLRSTDDPATCAGRALDRLGLPALPPAFGREAEVLAGIPGAQVIQRRSLLAGIRDTLREDSEPPQV